MCVKEFMRLKDCFLVSEVWSIAISPTLANPARPHLRRAEEKQPNAFKSLHGVAAFKARLFYEIMVFNFLFSFPSPVYYQFKWKKTHGHVIH